MPKGLLGLILSTLFSSVLICSAVIFTSHSGQAAPSPLPELRGACYFSGDKGCKPDLTQKECQSSVNNFNYWDAGKGCVESPHVLVEDEWIERCTDSKKLAEAEKRCREKLEAEVKAQESGTSPSPICTDKFQPVTKVAITASYVDKKSKLCVANCAMVYQCVEKVEMPPSMPPTAPPPPPPSDTPTPSSAPKPSSTPAPTYVPSPTQTPGMPTAPTPPPPSSTPTPSDKVPPPPPGF